MMKKTVFCSKTLLIGSGQLSRHLQFYCQALGWTVHKKFKPHQKSRKPLLFVWNRNQPLPVLAKALEECDQIWLCISDSAISDFIHQNLKNYRGKILHFSGALEIQGAISVHPLMTFSNQLYAESFYRQITWVHTQKLRWSWHFPGFSNPHRQISSADKVLYHLLCVLSGNLTQILLNTTSDLFSKMGLQQKNVTPFVLQSVFNQQALGWSGLTGPFQRNDQKTIQTHLQFLKSTTKSSIITTKQKKLIHQLYLDFYALYTQGKAK